MPSVDAALTELTEELVEAGLEPSDLDRYPQWDGSPLDLPLAIETMWAESSGEA